MRELFEQFARPPESRVTEVTRVTPDRKVSDFRMMSSRPAVTQGDAAVGNASNSRPIGASPVTPLPTPYNVRVTATTAENLTLDKDFSSPLPLLPVLPKDSSRGERNASEIAPASEPARVYLRQEGIEVQFIEEAAQAARIVERITSDGEPIGLDIETGKLTKYADHPQAGLDPHMSMIRLVQVYGGGSMAYVFDIRSVGLDTLAPIWNQPLVAHNAVFELKHLLHAGVRPERVDCTMLMTNAIDGGLPSLQVLAHTELGWEISKEEQTSDWNAAKLSEQQIAYGALDAVVARLLAGRLHARLRELGRQRLYELMRGAQEAIARLELAGLYFDRYRHVELMRGWVKAKDLAEQTLVALIGPTVNPSSPVQVARWLEPQLDDQTRANWPRTSTGVLRTDADTLRVNADHPVVGPLLQYKDASKRLSAFGEQYSAHISPATGRIHANFRLGGTATGRMSCSSPNMQNAPRDREFRALFSAPAGRVLVVADYSQIELRVAAIVSGDQRMLDVYERGEDLHCTTAAAILDIDPAAVTKDQRRAAKAVNFGLLYGQGPKGLARYAAASYGVQMSLADAEHARTVFFNRYSTLAAWQRRAGDAGRREGRVRTPSGRVRRLARGRYGYKATEAMNTPIQGGAAEVLLAALSILPQRLAGLDAVLVNVVHDELIVEVSVVDAEPTKLAVESAMIEGMLAIFPTASVNKLIEAKIVHNWGEAKS